MSNFIWILQGLLGVAFLTAGLGKLFGSKMHKDGFKKWRLPQWFRVVTGLVEAIAAALLLIGYWKEDFIRFGALLLVAVCIGGVLTHLRAKDSVKDAMPISVLGILALILLFLVY